MKKDYITYAGEQELEIITTTIGMNGYPEGLGKGIIGFETWDELKEAQEQIEEATEIVTFFRQDGWNLWQNHWARFEPMEISSQDYGDDYMMYRHSEIEYYRKSYKEERELLVEEGLSEKELEDFDKRSQEVLEELGKTKENEAVITLQGNYYETIEFKTLSWDHDSKHYRVGLKINE